VIEDEDLGVRGEAAPLDVLAAIKLALAAKSLAGDRQILNLIEWIVELEEPRSDRSIGTRLFIEAIKETRV
jgi:hypothetical protein